MKADISRWTCNGCNTKVETGVAGTPPHWMGVTLHQRIQSPEGSKRIHLCNDCAAKARVVLGVVGTSWWL